MTNFEGDDNYGPRIALSMIFGFFGVTVCYRCAALVQCEPELKAQHDAWHERLPDAAI